MGYREREGGSGGLSAECRGYELRDREGEKIGKVDEVFVDENDRPEYLGVKTGLLGNKLTLIPADLARADDERRLVEVSESRDRVKDAPSQGASEEITTEREGEIRSHFGLESGASSATGDGRDRDSSGGRGSDSPGYREGSGDNGSPESGGVEDRREDKREPWSGSGGNTGSDASGGAVGSAGAAQRGGETTGYGGGSSSGETGERRGDRGDASDRDADRETVRVSVWREKARAERVLGDDGSEEVRIRKEWVEEEELVEVENGRRGAGDTGNQSRERS